MNLKVIPDKPTCNCGVFGIFNSVEAATVTYYGLHSLQHRGQDACGIVTSDINEKGKNIFRLYKDFGLVSEVFGDANIFSSKLSGKSAIGHNRYSTSGSSASEKNIQPFVVNFRNGNLAIAHNGNLTNAKVLRKQLVDEGAIFQTSTDTEVVLHLIARSKKNELIDQILDALRKIEGAYSFTFLSDNKLIAARDPNGFRPLSIGKLDNSFIIASETCAFDINTAKYIRDVEPGELVVIDKAVKKTEDIVSYRIVENDIIPKHCIFEFIYFSRPDSFIFGSSVDKIRRKLGKVLASNHPVVDPDGDKIIVISVPDSSNTAAIGYSNQLEKDGIPSKHEIGLIRSHYIGRTFIQPGQQNREIGVRIKFNTVKGVLENRTIVIIDDSIVRGTTAKQLVKLVREANPKAIHFRISSPKILFPCYYGMDFPSKDELIANRFNGIQSIREYLGVDSLEYLTKEEMLDAMVDHPREHFCSACFSGQYPVNIQNVFNKNEYDD